MKEQDQSSTLPSEQLLALHNMHQQYNDFIAFKKDLPDLLKQGELADSCILLSRELGILEPLTGQHIPPEKLHIEGNNWRETLIANNLLSRNRGILFLLEYHYKSLSLLREMDIYLTEALSGFAKWMNQYLDKEHLICSEYLDGLEVSYPDLLHQDLCSLTFTNQSFDLVICNDIFEHIPYLTKAFSEIARVLKSGGRLIATCPLAFGQIESIIKATLDPNTNHINFLDDSEIHGDPLRPKQGSLIFQIPAWDILDNLKNAGFTQASIHHVASWKSGIIGSDLPGVLIVEAGISK